MTRREHWRPIPGARGYLRCDRHTFATFPAGEGCVGCWRAAVLAAGYVEGPVWSYAPVARERERGR